MERQKILRLIEDDDLELLKLEPEKQPPVTENERLLTSFKEINRFVSLHGREPQTSNDIQESKLFARLEGIRKNKEKIQLLREFDIYDLLNVEVKELNNIEDVFADDDQGLLEDDANNIFKLNHVPQKKRTPDYIAARKPCRDFEKFHKLFTDCQGDLSSGMRKLIPFRFEQRIDEGHFYVLKGVLVYVAKIGKRQINGVRTNPRLRCIFENQTESNLLLHSLAAALYKDGKRVTD